MKKLFLSFLMCLFTVSAVQAARVYADDYVYQKQMIMNPDQVRADEEIPTCQTFRIHPHWFATAAHCVDMCVFDGKCDIRILLAQGPVNVWTKVDKRDIFVPKQYRTVDAKKRVTTHKFWDVALIHYRPQEYHYEFAEGGTATAEEFNQHLKQYPELRSQWRGAIHPPIPTLYTYGGEDLMQLKQNIMVPRWNQGGELMVFSNPETVLYFGEKKSLWGTDDFGVKEGNSGGAVVLENGGIVGIATAKMNNNLPADVRREFPKFGQAYGFFAFNGFAPQTTLKFIEQTMRRFGDQPRVEKLKRVEPSTEAAL